MKEKTIDIIITLALIVMCASFFYLLVVYPYADIHYQVCKLFCIVSGMLAATLFCYIIGY